MFITKSGLGSVHLFVVGGYTELSFKKIDLEITRMKWQIDSTKILSCHVISKFMLPHHIL